MSRKGEVTPLDQHGSVECIFATHRATPWQKGPPTLEVACPQSCITFPSFYTCIKLLFHRKV
jgi:hypothetical protein